jgi:hypothetical protein
MFLYRGPRAPATIAKRFINACQLGAPTLAQQSLRGRYQISYASIALVTVRAQ